jgi:methionyl-tRNA synthetase
MANKKQKFSEMDLSWIFQGKSPDEMGLQEVMGPCPNDGSDYKNNGDCPVCGDNVSPVQVAQRRQWLKDHPGEEE